MKLVHSYCEGCRRRCLRWIAAGRVHGEHILTGSCSRVARSSSTATARTAATTARCETSECQNQHDHPNHRAPAPPPCRNPQEHHQRKDRAGSRHTQPWKHWPRQSSLCRRRSAHGSRPAPTRSKRGRGYRAFRSVRSRVCRTPRIKCARTQGHV